MFLAMVVYFIVFFSTIFSKRIKEEVLEIESSEHYENGYSKILNEFKVWIFLALILIIIAYTFVYYDVFISTRR
jgi:cytochrome c oxidase subunit 1